ncbi:U3 small nucleolar RNA-associated protein 13 [Kalmusia sp. IMI 367209]|nr:U3 small nucleolar RNA-associated protein 13 [Kalmusia sp. IMI 367209]
MAQRSAVKTTYDIERTLQPIYAGGSIALSEDGRILAACLGEDTLLTDVTNGRELGRIEGDGEPITALILTPSASHLIVCSRSTSMHIYSLVPSENEDDPFELELLRSLRPHTSPVVTLAVDKTGTLLATGGADGIVKVWDIHAGYTTHTFHGHGGVVSALHFFQVEVAENDDGGESSKKRKRRKSQQEATESSKNETSIEYRLASGAEDGKIRIWDLHKRKSAAVLDSHVSVVRSLDFSSEQNALVSGSRDKTLIIWDAEKWKAKRTIAVLEALESAGFVASGHIVFSGGENGRIRLWSAETSQEITREQEPGIETDAIVEVLHYPDLPYLISAHADQVLNFHSLGSIEAPLLEEIIDPLPVFRRVSGTHDEVIDLAYIGSDKSLLALNTNSEDVRIVTLKEGEAGETTTGGRYVGADVALLKGHEDLIISLDVDWSGHWLATGSKDNTARLWRIDPANDSYACAAVLTGHAESLGAIALPHTVPPESSAAYTDPLSHPPAYIITGSQDRTVKRWDTSKDMRQKLRAKYTRKAHDKDINAVDIDPSSTLFASASQDRTVKIYSAAEGEAVGVLRGHRRGVWTVKFQPKESQAIGSGGKGLVATGSADKTVKIWSLADYSCLLTLEGHSNSVLKLAWIPYRPIDARDKRGSQVASAAGDGLVKVWDSSSGEAMSTLDNHTDRVWALTAHLTTGALISGGADSIITFWKDTTSSTLEAATTAETERVELDQKLQNYAFAGNYREAITLALQMDQPGRLLSLFKSVVETETPDEGSLSGLTAVDEVIASLADEQLYKLLLRLRDWNTNVRTAPVAQKILWVVVKSYPASHLASLKPTGKVGAKGSLKDVLAAIKAYSERHYKRVEDLVDESYLLDFTLREMDDMGDVRNLTNGTSQLGLGGDVVMVE